MKCAGAQSSQSRTIRVSMTQVKDLSRPVCDCTIEFVELAGKKVIHAFDNDKIILTG